MLIEKLKACRHKYSSFLDVPYEEGRGLMILSEQDCRFSYEMFKLKESPKKKYVWTDGDNNYEFFHSRSEADEFVETKQDESFAKGWGTEDESNNPFVGGYYFDTAPPTDEERWNGMLCFKSDMEQFTTTSTYTGLESDIEHRPKVFVSVHLVPRNDTVKPFLLLEKFHMVVDTGCFHPTALSLPFLRSFHETMIDANISPTNYRVGGFSSNHDELPLKLSFKFGNKSVCGYPQTPSPGCMLGIGAIQILGPFFGFNATTGKHGFSENDPLGCASLTCDCALPIGLSPHLPLIFSECNSKYCSLNVQVAWA
jgi:hypothetical protein